MVNIQVSDYHQAIQNPSLCFVDPDLRGGAPELNQLGLPVPRAGNFAIVYRIITATRHWAVKCFFRTNADAQQRYAAIDAHLGAASLPYMVSFTYLPDGMRVLGQQRPILKMEWVHDGVLLHHYIEDCIGDPVHGRDRLQALAQQWKQMLEALEGGHIAHGDLQHGNVLVVKGALKLVDYDGMYVPTLAGRSIAERGHANYQHPQRTPADYGPLLDRFSAWVIYISIVAVRCDPRLWQQAHGGDDCLLFREQDFKDPDASPIFATLLHHADPDVRTLAARLRGFLAVKPALVPTLTDPQPAAVTASSGASSTIPSWLSGSPPPIVSGAAGTSRIPAWLASQSLTQRSPGRAKKVSATSHRSRIGAAITVVTAALIAVAFISPHLVGPSSRPDAAAGLFTEAQSQYNIGAIPAALVTFAQVLARYPGYSNGVLDELWADNVALRYGPNTKKRLLTLSALVSLAKAVHTSAIAQQAGAQLSALATSALPPQQQVADEQSWRLEGDGGDGARYSQLGGIPPTGQRLLTRTVFAASQDHLLYALDAYTGQLRWQRKLDARGVAVAGGTVYVGSLNHHVYALQAVSGHIRWSFAADGSVVAAPTVADGYVFFGSVDHAVYALRAATGTLAWRYRTHGAVTASAVVVGGRVYIGSADHRLYVLDERSGKLRWRFEARTAFQTSPAVTGTTVLAAARQDALFALNAQNGKLRWRFNLGKAIPATPIEVSGVIYFASSSRRLYALNAGTGRIIWKFTTDGAIAGGPSTVDSLVYVASSDHRLYAVQRSTGRLVWRFTAADALEASCAVGPGLLSCGSKGRMLYGVDALTGQLVWKTPTGGGITSAPAMVGY